MFWLVGCMREDMLNVFDVCARYFEGGISSVYLWDKEEGSGFSGVVLIKKGTL